MKSYAEYSKEELEVLVASLREEYEKEKGLGLKLDMSRGKPSPMQLDTVMPLMDQLSSKTELKTDLGTDCRNYGALDGIDEAKRLVAEMVGTTMDHIIICGNSSLSIMYDTVSRAYTHGVCGSTPWCKLDSIKWLCPAPGYDRHFRITEHFGIELITVPMNADGPDMDEVERLVSSDVSIKGIWCVPKYSNPTGCTYSEEVIRRLAHLNTAASDFRIYWDNAYCVHDLYEDKRDYLPDMLQICAEAGNPDLVLEFCSTSKITFSGSGISAVAASEANLKWFRSSLSVQTIGYDKINQLRHAHYFNNLEGVMEQMKKHASFLRPKFEKVLEIFEEEKIEELGIGSYTKPLGGYFISFDTIDGCAKKVVGLCKEAGVVLTDAGATFPYGKDPKDSNIRIAPSFPTPDELAKAAELFCLCVKLVSAEKLLAEKA